MTFNKKTRRIWLNS